MRVHQPPMIINALSTLAPGGLRECDRGVPMGLLPANVDEWPLAHARGSASIVYLYPNRDRKEAASAWTFSGAPPDCHRGLGTMHRGRSS